MMLSWLVPLECTEAILYLQHSLNINIKKLVFKWPDDAHVVTASTCMGEEMKRAVMN